jgi:hypothetical protein
VSSALPEVTLPPSAALMRTEPAGGGPRALSDEESTLAGLSLAGAVEELDDAPPPSADALLVAGVPPDDEPARASAP